MMEYLVNNFQSYAETYIAVLIELYLILDVVLLRYNADGTAWCCIRPELIEL